MSHVFDGFHCVHWLQAAKCGELERLATAAGKGLFTTPPGAVLAFGCMELALEASGAAAEFKTAVKVRRANEGGGR